jgi:hypothetical protein
LAAPVGPAQSGFGFADLAGQLDLLVRGRCWLALLLET